MCGTVRFPGGRSREAVVWSLRCDRDLKVLDNGHGAAEFVFSLLDLILFWYRFFLFVCFDIVPVLLFGMGMFSLCHSVLKLSNFMF